RVGRPMRLDLREIVNAIFYGVRTGCQWMNLPTGYPHPKSVYYHFRRWCVDGTWEQLNRALIYLQRQNCGCLPHPSGGSSTVKVPKPPNAGANAVTTAARK